MSHDVDLTDTVERTVTLSFTAGGQGCWIFVREGQGEADKVRLDGDSGEAMRVSRAIRDYYAGEVPTREPVPVEAKTIPGDPLGQRLSVTCPCGCKTTMFVSDRLFYPCDLPHIEYDE